MTKVVNVKAKNLTLKDTVLGNNRMGPGSSRDCRVRHLFRQSVDGSPHVFVVLNKNGRGMRVVDFHEEDFVRVRRPRSLNSRKVRI